MTNAMRFHRINISFLSAEERCNTKKTNDKLKKNGTERGGLYWVEVKSKYDNRKQRRSYQSE